MPEHNVEVKCYYEIKTFTITWVNYDNSLLGTTTVEYGLMPEYSGLITPTKESTVEFDYIFEDKWTPSVTEATKDTTYTAVFTETKRSYVIKFVNHDGTELETQNIEYGLTPIYNGATPTKESTVEFDYIFEDEWTPKITSVQGDAVYTATFVEQDRLYEIKFMNEGVVFEKQSLKYNSTPTIPDKIPTKQSTEQHNYTFDKWIPEITNVNGNAIYTASYIEEDRYYIVRFLDNDGIVLQEENLVYGSTPKYSGSTTPTKESTVEFDYIFEDEWTPTIDTVKSNIDYYPLFNSITRKYVVRFFDANGKITQEETLEYGSTPTIPDKIPTKEATPEYSYEFKGWTPTLDNVTGNVDYYPEFEEIKRKYDIVFKYGKDNKDSETLTLE
jgi:hypothetical protein